ncbi:MAG: hypothetical protein Q8Q01_03205 [archaeon]|nr:hypothetical protein [archaeon]
MIETVEGNYPALSKLVSGTRRHVDGNPVLMPKTATYALGAQALRDSYARGECPTHPLFTNVVRPLTFRENLEARVNDYENNRGKKERLRLFNKWLDSCTGIAYKKGTDKFKIIPISPDLVTIPRDFNNHFIQVDYDGLAGTELDRSGGKYNQLLTTDEVLAHPAWRVAVEGDIALLRTYRDIVFAEKKSLNKLMRFWLHDDPNKDQLRALFVNDLDYGSSAGGSNDLGDGGSFLRVAPSSPKELTPEERVLQKGRLSVFEGMEGGELSVIGESVGGLTVADVTEEVFKPKRRRLFGIF